MEIMFDDLTFEAQERLLYEAGITTPEDMHWDEVPVAVVELSEDEIPLAVVEFSEDDHEPEEDEFDEDIFDDFDYNEN